MRHRPTIILSLLAVTAAFAAADPLDAVFAQIDAAAKTFRSVSAAIADTQHTSLVDSDETKIGLFKLVSTKDGARMRIDYEGAQTIVYDAQGGLVFNPKTKVADQYGLSKQQQEEATQFLALGFGATSAELKAAYDISWVAEDKIGTQTTSHLKLIPKAADLRKSIRQADLWYGGNGVVVQQKFLQPSGDYKLVKYSNLQLGNVTDKDVELKLPKGTTIQKH